jgi:Tfp pilus assembly protein PilF
MLEQEKEGKPRYYMVGPYIKNAEEAFWEGRKVSSIKLSFKEFLETIDKSISKQNRVLSKAIPITEFPIHSQFVVNINDVRPSASLQSFMQNDIDYVHSALTSPNSSPKEFYKGYFNNWDPIIRSLDVQRRATDSILSEIFLEDIYSGDDKGPLFILIQGYAGSGKSVVLKRLAWDAAVEFQKFCIFYRPNTSIRYENISELYNFVKRRIFIFVDNALSKDEEVKKLLDRSVKDKLPITLVASERTNVWNQENNTLKNYLDYSYKIEYLNDKEIDELLDLLTKHNSLNFLEGKPREEQKLLLGPKAGRVLLVALYEATHGKPFRDIVKDEYDRIQPDAAKSLYLTVSLLHMLGSAARAGLISRVHGISFHRFTEEFFKPLEFIVFDKKDYKINDYVYLTRHPYIAQMVFETVLTDEQSRFDEFMRILAYLDIDFDNDRSAFIYLTNAKRLLEHFPNRILIYNIYKKALEISPNNPKLLQQMAIMEIETKNVLKAEQHIYEANELMKGADPIILHTFAEIEFRKAESSKNALEKNGFLDKAMRLCDKLLKDFGPSPFPFHTILKSLNAKLELALISSDSPTIERIIKDIERRLRDAKQAFALHEFILEVEASFNQIVNNTPEALTLLIKAHEVNRSSPFIATRLSNIYESNGDIDKALSVLNETLNNIPGDKDINYNYAMLLMKKNPENYKDLLYYLKKSFTEGDNRYQAQFWYARTLFLSNQIDESKSLFKRLSQLNIDPQIKNTPVGIIETGGKATLFSGRIRMLELSYGFLKRDLYGDDIFISKHESYDNWHKLKFNDPVTFNVGFNYKGAVGVNVQFKSN